MEGDIHHGADIDPILPLICKTLLGGVWILGARGGVKCGNPAGLRIRGGGKYAGVKNSGSTRGLGPIPESHSAVSMGRGENHRKWRGVSVNEAIDIECFDGGIVRDRSRDARRKSGPASNGLIFETCPVRCGMSVANCTSDASPPQLSPNWPPASEEPRQLSVRAMSRFGPGLEVMEG